ncbi:aldehyde ferredoxin oxidoreductase [Candidatus Bathyarchaeota archaeon]|nr:MAG: aldehyde ferredoxin oxidoreductase [Candidatus Bathyarchaeota archaeon]
MGDEEIKVAAIGPAGENLVKFACITNDLYRQAARGGTGAVMGSKNLKAVAVRGTGGVKVPDIDAYMELCREIIKEDVLGNPDNEWATTDGTPIIVDLSQEAALLPTRNFQSGEFEHAGRINSEAMKKEIVARRKACYGCPLGCGNLSRIKTGPFANTVVEGPEYETLALVGSNCGIDRLDAIARFNLLCDDLGLDTISTGNVVAWAMELYERGIIGPEDTGGLELRFGNVDAYIKMPELIAFRKGIGDILAEGVARAAKAIGKGSERYALHVKGLEYPGYDPRGSIGMALAYATSDRGACHLRSWIVAVEAFGELDPFTPEGKAKIVIEDQDRNSVKWSFIICDFYAIGYENMARLGSACTGWDLKPEELKLIGERIWNLTRMFNVREGFTRKDDSLPPRMSQDPLPSGKTKGKVVRPEDFEKMLDEYYRLRGWDENGVPRPETLARLGLA